MALTDSRGNPASTDNEDALERYETAQALFHGYYGDPVGVIDEALARDPQICSASVSRG
jgi:hypothetical protein